MTDGLLAEHRIFTENQRDGFDNGIERAGRQVQIINDPSGTPRAAPNINRRSTEARTMETCADYCPGTGVPLKAFTALSIRT